MATDSLSDNNSYEQLPYQVSMEYKELTYIASLICQYIEDLQESLIVVEKQDKNECGIIFFGFKKTQTVLTSLTRLKHRLSEVLKDVISKSV